MEHASTGCWGGPVFSTYTVDDPGLSIICPVSAILRIFTPSGFLVAADGKQTRVDTDGKLKTTGDSQKIFVTAGTDRALAFGLIGSISNADESFSIAGEAAAAAKQLLDRKFENFKKYLYRFSRIVKRPLEVALVGGQFHPILRPNHQRPSERDVIADILFAGYFRTRPILGSIRFSYPSKILASPSLEVSNPVIGHWVVSGPRIGHLVLRKSTDPRLASFRCQRDSADSLASAAVCARQFIRACESNEAKEVDPDCEGVGGKIHFVFIAPSGIEQSTEL